MICRRCCKRLLQRNAGLRATDSYLSSISARIAIASFSTRPNHGSSGKVQDGTRQHLRMWKDRKVAVKYLTDPLKLAEHTQYLLKNGEEAMALEEVRLASKDKACTVSWNHLINAAMGKGQVQAALDIYNEMKKRRQIPDAFTYTIVLRGLARNLYKTPTAVERALSIFHSMLSPTCPVKPNTIHVNAAIEVCAKARNLDALYGITARLPENGPGSPDGWTYSMIFNCLADVATVAREKGASFKNAEVPPLTKEMVSQGKRIWADVVLRWIGGNINMDEQLVCSMGRLLLLGDVKNSDEVLSLVQQAAMLTREIPPIGDKERPQHRIRYDRTASKDTATEHADTNTTADHTADLAFSDEDVASQNLFKATPQSSVMRSYAIPGNEMLSMVMESCLNMHAIKAAQGYWGKISSAVKPDLGNFHAYLRILRLSRASALTTELLRQMATPKDQDGFGMRLQTKSFLIAMSVCKRDLNNPNCLRHTTSILNMMSNTLQVPDVYATRTAAEIIDARLKKWAINDILRAIDALEANYALLKPHYSYGASAVSIPVTNKWRDDLVAALRTYCDVIQRVLGTFREQIDPDKALLLSKRLEVHTGSYDRWSAANTKRAMQTSRTVKSVEKTLDLKSGKKDALLKTAI